MDFDAQYYAIRIQTLQQRNQKVTQKFLGDTLAYAQAISEIENDYQDITKMEAEQSKKEESKPAPKK